MVLALAIWSALIVILNIWLTFTTEGENQIMVPYVWFISLWAIILPWAVFGLASLISWLL